MCKNIGTAYKLVLLRHGESEWNAKNLSTGWIDVPLSKRGRVETTYDGELLESEGALPDILHTFPLRRAVMTANLALGVASRHQTPVCRTWRLNERHYCALQGMNKKTIRGEYGEELFMQWRRLYNVSLPAIEKGSEFSQDADSCYAGEPIPSSGYLKDVLERTLPYWSDAITPDLKAGKTVMITTHGNSLHIIVKHLDSISDEEISGLNVPTGIPPYYELGEDMKPVVPGRCLDPQAAENVIRAVANQGEQSV